MTFYSPSRQGRHTNQTTMASKKSQNILMRVTTDLFLSLSLMLKTITFYKIIDMKNLYAREIYCYNFREHFQRNFMFPGQRVVVLHSSNSFGRVQPKRIKLRVTSNDRRTPVPEQQSAFLFYLLLFFLLFLFTGPKFEN